MGLVDRIVQEHTLRNGCITDSREVVGLEANGPILHKAAAALGGEPLYLKLRECRKHAMTLKKRI